MQALINQGCVDDFKKRFHSYLDKVGITPKITEKGNCKVYSTEFASLIIENYPLTDNAIFLMRPLSDEHENTNSLKLALVYIEAAIEDNDGMKFIDAFNRVLDKEKPQIIHMGGFAIKITIQKKKQNVDRRVAIEIKKIPDGAHVTFRQNKDKLFRSRF